MHADRVVECAEAVAKDLVGAQITGACIDKEETMYGFVIELPNGKRYNIWVQSDPEGNDAGWLEWEAR